MRWLRRSSETPQLLSLSPLRTGESLSISIVNIDDEKSNVSRNQTPNHSTRKSRIDQLSSLSPSQPFSWSRKLTKSTENCYNIQEGKVVERGLKGRFVSPIRVKNKHNLSNRSTSPDAQSITSSRTIPTSTPTHQSQFNNNNHSQTLNWRVLQREKLALDASAADKSEANYDSETRLNDERGCFRSAKSEFNRTIGGYSVPYREKRNPLSSTRLSCYIPVTSDTNFESFNLKNYKSVDDFLSLGESELSYPSIPYNASSKDLRTVSDNSATETPKMDQRLDGPEVNHKIKKHGLGGKFRSMTGKTQKLFSRIYSSSSLKSANSSSSDVCNDFIIQRTIKTPVNEINNRRSLSYGALPGMNEFDVKKIEIEDGDSGILENESGASSMLETDSGLEDSKTEVKPALEFRETLRRDTNEDDDNNKTQTKNKLFDLSACRHSSSSDQILSSPSNAKSQILRNKSMDELNDRTENETQKRNSIVLEIVAMIEKKETKFNTMRNPRRSKAFVMTTSHADSQLGAIKNQNLCDDDKLKLQSSQSKEKLCDDFSRSNFDDSVTEIKTSSNFCTLPRRPKTSPHCTFLTVAFEKGPGKKSLGFTIVGGADSPRGALGIFIKSIMPKGQAIDSGQLRAGDEILAVNGQVCHDLTHQDAVRMFKIVKSGEIVLNICRRKNV